MESLIIFQSQFSSTLFHVGTKAIPRNAQANLMIKKVSLEMEENIPIFQVIEKVLFGLLALSNKTHFQGVTLLAQRT